MSNTDFQDIKKRLHEEELLEDLLDALDCENIRRTGSRWEARLPYKFGSKNNRAVQVYEGEYLASKIRNKSISGDIYLLIGYILYGVTDSEELKDVLHQVKTWICNLFNWNEYLERRDYFEEEKKDHLSFLRPVQKKRKKRSRFKSLIEKENVVLDEDSVYNVFDKLPHVNFLKDGISLKTQREFEVMFDRDSERVVFPIHNQHGELISIKGRYVGKDEQTLEQYKYMYLYNFDKMIELYNLHRAFDYIKKTGEVIVFESEKSCMKAWQYGFKNTVALMGSEMSPIQAFLLKRLGVNIIFAYDKDMNEEFVRKQSKQISTRKCFWVNDKNNWLGEKCAPVDMGEEIWIKLYEECVETL